MSFLISPCESQKGIKIKSESRIRLAEVDVLRGVHLPRVHPVRRAQHRIASINQHPIKQCMDKYDVESMSHLPVYRFIGVWQQESGKGPRLADGAAKLRPPYDE